MNIPAAWQTSRMTSCLHAARQVVAGRPLNDARIAKALAEIAHRFDVELREILAHSNAAAAFLAGPDLWQLLLELSLDDPASSELAARFCCRWGHDSRADGAMESRVADTLSQLNSTLLEVLPRLPFELPLRVGPLREQWEARGPGFLAQAARLTQLPLATLGSRVVLVHPVLGGDGTPHFLADTIQFEAVLVNANWRLPETMRLGWLLMQLAAWPLFAAIPLLHRRQFVATVTLLPAIEAGQHVELAPPDPRLLREALDAWLPNQLPPGAAARIASLVPQSDQPWRSAARAFYTLWT